ncbi:MAG: response regulator [Lachnospirales bacterium]
MLNKVIIVDDETVVRFTLRTTIDWEKYGFEIIKDFNSSVNALEYLKNNKVDLLITDMKMPNMTGLDLLRELNKLNNRPISLVLSGYDEFNLVREAFKLGAYDYILKSNLESIVKILPILKNKELAESKNIQMEIIPDNAIDLEEGKYCVALFEINDFIKQSSRFGNDLYNNMEKPLLEIARQINRIANKTKFYSINPARYILYYKVNKGLKYETTVVSIVKQLLSVWSRYMNINASVGISEAVELEKLDQTFLINELLLGVSIIKGEGLIITEWEDGKRALKFDQLTKKYEALVKFLYLSDELNLVNEKQLFFINITDMEISEAHEEVLGVIYSLAMKFLEYDDEFFSIFPERINYEEKVKRLKTIKEIEIWINNYFSWVLKYLENREQNKQNDIMLKAKRFINDNYINSELTLKNVSDYVGLNEKYFSSRFTKEFGCTFSSYIVDIRLWKAKSLIGTTDLKMYEISDRVGYNNVEHFNRVFKKTMCMTPTEYKRSLNQ